MQKISKYLPLFIAVCAIADTSFDVLVGIGLSSVLINYIKLVGLLTSVLLPTLESLLNEPQIPNNPVLKSESVESDLYGKRPKKRGELDSEEIG